MSATVDQFQFNTFKANVIQHRILKDAGINGPNDPRFRQVLKASLDFTYHAELYFPDPSKPDLPLRLEPWQKSELRYAQYGDYFNSLGQAVRKPIAINSPRGFGKSIYSAITADEFALHFPNTKIALFSTSQDQANDIMTKVKYFINKSMFAFMMDKNINSKMHIGLINGSEIKAFPQSEVTIRGYHPHIKIIDEKSRIKRIILEEAIRPMGRKDCWLEIGISTPFGMNNNHYEDCTNPDIFHIRLLNPTDVSWVDQEKLDLESKMMGERAAKQELYAQFLSDEDTVFNPTLIELMLDNDLKPTTIPYPLNNYVVGIDFGKHTDYTATTIIHKEKNGQIKIDWIERHRRRDYIREIQRLSELCDLFDAKFVIPDGTGVGIAVMEQLVRKINTPIYRSRLKKKDEYGKEQFRDGFIFSNTSKLNLVDELLNYMEHSQIKCPNHFNATNSADDRYIFKVLENEMLGFTYKRTAFGNIIFGNEDSKTHDDVVISVMLAVWGLRFMKDIKPHTTFGASTSIRDKPKSERNNTRYFGVPRG